MNWVPSRQSLTTRVTLVSLAIFVVSIWLLAFVASRTLRQEMQVLLGEQQFNMTTILAKGLDAALAGRLSALESAARRVFPATMGNPKSMQAFLDDRPGLIELFSAGVYVTRPDGIVIADSKPALGRIGGNYADREYIADALAGKAKVGKLIWGKKTRLPGIPISVPIRNDKGEVVGTLTGGINLAGRNFLDQIAQSGKGKSGGFVLIALPENLIVAASDKSRVMQNIASQGTNPMWEKYRQGYEGYGIAADAEGKEQLSAAIAIPSAGWLLVTMLPTDQAFAPILSMQRNVLIATILLTLLSGTLIWWILRRELAPLRATANAIGTLSETSAIPAPLPVASKDEIGQLIAGFNRLLERWQQRENKLRESRKDLSGVIDQTPISMALVLMDGTIEYINSKAIDTFGYLPQDIPTMAEWWELAYPDLTYRAEVQTVWMGLLQDARLNNREIEKREYRVTCKNRSVIATLIYGIWVEDKVLVMFDDITERKRLEQMRLDEERAHREALVREVHHRIKNNLQSVAGLLQRELGKFLELDPRLETAISQINVISVVHGLQSSDASEAIRLQEVVHNICKSVSSIAQQPVPFNATPAAPGLDQIEISSEEAVSVALVLNELILNAVKHSPSGSLSPTVTLGLEASAAQLLICNAISGAPVFDMESGKGLGTGLSLVRSLLPERGAKLSYALVGSGIMLTRLTLAAPVILMPSQESP